MLRRIWVGSLGAYAAGNLVGGWITLDDHDEESFHAEVKRVTKEADEAWVMDHEGFGSFGEMSPAEAWRMHEALDDVDEPEALLAYADHIGEDVSDALESFEDAYRGKWESELAYATDLADDCGYVPTNPPAYIYFDYQAYARDLFMGDYFSVPIPPHAGTYGQGVYVFSSY